jgi:hypothetical protein
MGIRETLAARTRKKLRFAILRPNNQQAIPAVLNRFAGRSEIPGDEFEQAVAKLGVEYIFMGYAKRDCRTLFNRDGSPIAGATIQPGDVIDEIEEFDRAVITGAYQPIGHTDHASS